MTQSSNRRPRLTRHGASVLLLAAVLVTAGGRGDDLDRIVNGGQFPPGGYARPDRGTPQ